MDTSRFFITFNNYLGLLMQAQAVRTSAGIQRHDGSQKTDYQKPDRRRKINI
jgi:hypothetical protein